MQSTVHQPLPSIRFRAAEFFAGIGLVGDALTPEGIEVIWANDIDFWHDAVPGEAEGAFALDIDTYRARFAGTGVSA